jgi:hypothetical protein
MYSSRGAHTSAFRFQHSFSVTRRQFNLQLIVMTVECRRFARPSCSLTPTALTRHSFLPRAKRTFDQGNASVGTPPENFYDLSGENEPTPFTKGFSADSDQSFVVALSALRKAWYSYAQLNSELAGTFQEQGSYWNGEHLCSDAHRNRTHCPLKPRVGPVQLGRGG